MRRGELWWSDLGEPVGSAPGYRRPVLVVQTDVVNASGLQTVIIVSLSSNLELSTARGNVLVTAEETGLAMDSVVNVTQFLTVDKRQLEGKIGRLTPRLMSVVDAGLRTILGL